MHGSVLYLQSRGWAPHRMWRLGLATGGTAAGIPIPDPVPDVLVPQSASSGTVTLAPSEERVFAFTVAGAFAKRFHVLEAGVTIIDQSTAPNGSQQLWVRKKGDATYTYRSTVPSERYIMRQDMGTSLASYVWSGGNVIEILVCNTSTATTVVNARITYGWGLA